MTELMSKKLESINMNLVDVSEKPALNLYGIDAIDAILKPICLIANNVVNKKGWGNYLYLLMDVPAVVSSVDKLKGEILDITEDEIMSLENKAKEYLDFEDDKLEEKVEDILVATLLLVRSFV